MRGGLESTRLVEDRFRINTMGDYIIFDRSLQYNISSTLTLLRNHKKCNLLCVSFLFLNYRYVVYISRYLCIIHSFGGTEFEDCVN